MFKPWLILVLPAVPRPRFWRDHRYPVDVLIANASEAWLWVIYWEHLEVYSHMTQLFLMISELVSPPVSLVSLILGLPSSDGKREHLHVRSDAHRPITF
jgi:hypothetical protein